MSVSELSSCEAIRPILSSYVDGEATESEVALAKSHILQCAACASHLAFLRLTDTVLSDTPDVFPPASLSARIALATYARPSFSDRLRIWLSPAPVRFGVFGTAVATGIVAVLVLQHPITQVPVANNTPAQTTPKTVEPAPIVETSTPANIASGNASTVQVKPMPPKRTVTHPTVVASISKAVENANARMHESLSTPKPSTQNASTVKPHHDTLVATNPSKSQAKPASTITRPASNNMIASKTNHSTATITTPVTQEPHVAMAETKHDPVAPEPTIPKPEPVTPIKPQPDPNALVGVTEGREDSGPLSSRLGNAGKAASVKGSVSPNGVKQNESLLASGQPFISAPVK